jgi:ADP-ribose pyrophosphatase YjhB (NUDIX family)/GNAT superfamily N-acetyltransferase
MTSWEEVPVFGERVVGQSYVARPSAYAIIENEHGEIALVVTPVGRFLPGGGMEPGETPEQAVVREAREECGLVVWAGPTVGRAVQLVHARSEETYFEKRNVFLRAFIQAAGVPPSESDHHLSWVRRETAAEGLVDGSHSWALRAAMRSDAVVAGYTIAPASPHHLDALAAVELSAATLLRGHAPEAVLNSTIPGPQLDEAQRAGRLWVALAAGDVPVGFAIVKMLAPDLPHLDEIDVTPGHGRRGLGRAMVQAACDWALRSGYRELTLTTFRAVAWNMPFYARFGFVEIPAGELRPELAAVIANEAARGMDPAGRVAMRFRFPG